MEKIIWINLLLLLCNNFALGANEPCGRPTVPEHSSLRDVADDATQFEHGSLVKYKCDTGYSLSGYFLRTCSDGVWSNIGFTCDEIFCGHVTAPDNGRVKNEPTYRIGSLIDFECNEGYILEGNSRFLCGVDGNWRYSSEPRCERIMCPPLHDISRGSIFQDSSDGTRDDYLSVTVYTCQRGYRIFGTEQIYWRTCQHDGQWSGEEPYCDAPKCEDLNPFAGGRLKYDEDRREHSRAFFKCNNGFSFHPKEVNNSKCEEESSGVFKWTPEPSRCYKKHEVIVPTNCQTRYGEKELTHLQSYVLLNRAGYEFYADNAYLGINSLILTNNNGSLDKVIPKCVPERCDTSSLKYTEVYYMNNTKANEKVDSHMDYKFECVDRFEFQDDQYNNGNEVKKRCEYGKFINVPKCAEKRCRLDANLDFVPRGITKVDHLGQVDIECRDDKKELYSNQSKTYVEPFSAVCSYGRFREEVNTLTCVPKRCDTSSLENTKVYHMDNTEANEKVDSGKEYKIKCIYDHEFENDQFNNDNDVKIRCESGEFMYVQECVPKRCRLDANLDFVPRVITTVEHSKQVDIACRDDKKELYSNQSDTFVKPFSVQCSYGRFREEVNSLTCVPKRCTLLQSDGHCYYRRNPRDCLTNSPFNTRSGKVLHLRCLDNYSIDRIPADGMPAREQDVEMECREGNFLKQYRCVADPCTKPVLTNAKTNYTGETVLNGETIPFTCEKGYHIKGTHNLKQWRGLCKAGAIQDIPTGCVPDACSKLVDTKGFYVHEETQETVTTGVIEHGVKLQLKCFDGFDAVDKNNEIVNATDAIVTCDRGGWLNTYTCKSCLKEPNASAEINKDNSTNEVKTCTEVKDAKEATPESECSLQHYDVYEYTDKFGYVFESNDTVQSGEQVNVACLYPIIDYDYDAVSVVNTTCYDGNFSNFSLKCGDSESEVLPDLCKDYTLKNGVVRRINIGTYNVSCDPGYSMPNTMREHHCSCSEGKIVCLAGAEPVCGPDNCVIPLDMDRRLSVTKSWVIQTENQIIKHQDVLLFNCSNVAVQKYEPVNRQFRCELGQWIEADQRNPDWRHGNNGSFPTCREAICVPPCRNGGICNKDDECRCGHMTSGARCEIFLCHPNCKNNGGECIQPGVCGNCPKTRFGDMCEKKVTCKWPETSARYDGDQTIFYPGDKIHANKMHCDEGYALLSNDNMTCQHDGTWTEVIDCIITCVLPHTAARYETNRKTFYPGEAIEPHQMHCDEKLTLSSGVRMTCQNDGTWTNIIECVRNTNFKYLLRIQISSYRSAGTKNNVFVTIHGDRHHTVEFPMTQDFNQRDKVVEQELRGPDVRPLQKIVVRKDKRWYQVFKDDELNVEFVSVFIEDGDEYVVFRSQSDERSVWVDAKSPTEFIISKHPQACTHIYGPPVNKYHTSGCRSFYQQKVSFRECKQRCVTTRYHERKHFTCGSIYFIPTEKDFGFCHLIEQATSDECFVERNKASTKMSYDRVCKA